MEAPTCVGNRGATLEGGARGASQPRRESPRKMASGTSKVLAWLKLEVLVWFKLEVLEQGKQDLWDEQSTVAAKSAAIGPKLRLLVSFPTKSAYSG